MKGQLTPTKKTFYISIISIVLMVCATPLLYAGAGRTAAQFLSLGGGTRAAALGNAFTAVSSDVTAAFWNPSGINGISKVQFALAYTDYSVLFGEAGKGLNYTLLAGAMPLGDLGVIGTTLQLNGQGTTQIRIDSPEPVGEINLGMNWAWTLTYADEIMPNLTAGISGKIIRQKLGKESGTAYAIDLGTQYNLSVFSNPVSLGASIQNWGTRIQFKDENQSDPLPRTLKVGAAVSLLNNKYHKLQIVGDFTSFIDKLRGDDEEGLNKFVDDKYKKQEENPEVFKNWWFEGNSEEELSSKTKKEIRKEVEARRGVGINAFRYGNMAKSIGFEYLLGDILALRVGYKVDPFVDIVINDFEDHHQRITYGLGIRFGNYRLDFASSPGGGPENMRLNTFSLLIKF